MKLNLLLPIIFLGLITSCSSNPPMAPKPPIDLGVPRPTAEQLQRMMCHNAQANGEWSAWIEQGPTKHKLFTGCFDSNANDPRKRETTYLYSFKTGNYPRNQKDVALPNPTPGTCTSKDDFCGAEGTRAAGLNQTVCKKDPSTGVWSIATEYFKCSVLDTATEKYVCREGACVAKSSFTADLVIKNISTPVASKDCNSYFSFQVCNESTNAVQRDFKIKITVNGSNAEITYPASQNPIGANSCITITEPQKFSILAFGLGLNQNVNFSAEVNPAPRTVVESNYNNNSSSAVVSTGTAWMYNATTPCETFCYDTDFNTSLNGSADPKVRGTLYSTRDGFAYSREEKCTRENGPDISEYYCATPTIVNGVATNLFQARGMNCTEAFSAQGLPGVCKDGACVVANSYPTCTDSDAGINTTTFGTVTYNSPAAAGANGYDPNTTLPTQTANDYCQSVNQLEEQFCYANTLVSSSQLCDTPQTPGHICDQGRCVPGGSCSCAMTDSSGNTVTSNLLNRVETATRTCNGSVVSSATDNCWIDYNELYQRSCDVNGFLSVTTTKCSDQGPGWGCHAGTCVAPNAALKSCTDSDQQGVPDYTTAGSIVQVDEFGNNRASETESCDPDGLHLAEWYCGTDKTAKINRYNCANQGKVCRSGACVNP